mgnify:CR=1 FL=1
MLKYTKKVCFSECMKNMHEGGKFMSEYKIGTKCVQGGYTPGNGEPRQIPIVQSTTFKYEPSEDMGKLFDLEASGYFYSRLQNPTNDTVAAKIAEMEGGTAAMLTSSGQAANFFALFNICECGDHIVASSSIYGGTFNLIDVTMRKMGIDVTFVSPDATEEELAAMVRDYNVQVQIVRTSKRSVELAENILKEAVERFRLGKDDINNLFDSMMRKDEAGMNYVRALYSCWLTFYRIRQMTAYDFQQECPMEIHLTLEK